jgi:alcohol dehydrogenase (cytochrome c)
LIAQQGPNSSSTGPDLPPIPNGPGGGLSPFAALPPAAARPDLLGKLTSVTDAMLANPPAGDWLTWRRTYDDMGFSPLKQIDRTNVANLRVAWAWSLPPGADESTPLVHDGVLFIFGFGDRVQALDAATGDLLWQYSRQLPKESQPGVKRNLALYGDKLFVPTSDVHMVALNAKTGRVVWDHAVAQTPRFSDPALRMLASNWQIAPILQIKSAQFFTIIPGTDRALTTAPAQTGNLLNPDGSTLAIKA